MQAEIKAEKEKHIESTSLYLERHKKASEKGYKDLGDKKYEPFFENLYNISGESKQLLKEIKVGKAKSKDKGLDLGF